MSDSAEDCAKELLETVPFIMNIIRAEMRRYSAVNLSVPQFRVMTFINHHQGASLSAVAEHIGLTNPSMSVIVNILVERDLVLRKTAPHDRRRITLDLTEEGIRVLQESRRNTLMNLAGVLSSLSREDQEMVINGMELLRHNLAPLKKEATS
jgi:DNA-binding MarR family transcriptional regulator